MRAKSKAIVESSGNETRAHLRLQYQAEASLWILGTFYRGETRNISEGGLLFCTTQPLSPDIELRQWRVGRVAFVLPHFSKPLQQDVRVVWARQNNQVMAGVQFLQALPKVALFVLDELRRRQLMGL